MEEFGPWRLVSVRIGQEFLDDDTSITYSTTNVGSFGFSGNEFDFVLTLSMAIFNTPVSTIETGTPVDTCTTFDDRLTKWFTKEASHWITRSLPYRTQHVARSS